MILAPGATITERKSEIDQFVEEHQPLIIAANFIPEQYNCDYVFCSNAMRYSAMEEKVDREKLLITSNLMDVCEKARILNYAELCLDDKGKCDNCVIMLIKLLIRLGITEVTVAGFDGYQSEKCNYASSYMASQHTKGLEENIRIRRYVDDLQKQMDISFLTKSVYVE